MILGFLYCEERERREIFEHFVQESHVSCLASQPILDLVHAEGKREGE